MQQENRYLIIANRNGSLSVTVRFDFVERRGDVILHSAATIDEAFDWKEDMEARIARVDGHCPSCG